MSDDNNKTEDATNTPDQDKKAKSKKEFYRWVLAPFAVMGGLSALMVADLIIEDAKLNKDQPDYKSIDTDTKAQIERINKMAGAFAEQYSACAPGKSDTERYIETRRLISSFTDSALLQSVDSKTFVSDIEHAMLKEVRIIPADLPEGVLGVFYDNADNGKDVLALQKNTKAVYGVFPRFFNYLSQNNFDTEGRMAVLSQTDKPGQFQIGVFANPEDITINGEKMARTLAPGLHFSQPCRP